MLSQRYDFMQQQHTIADTQMQIKKFAGETERESERERGKEKENERKIKAVATNVIHFNFIAQEEYFYFVRIILTFYLH